MDHAKARKLCTGTKFANVKSDIQSRVHAANTYTLTSVNDALRIVIGCLRPKPTDHLPILSGIQPAELRRLGVTLSLAKGGTLDPDPILHGQLAGLPDVPRERLKSRHPFVPAARKLLNDLSKLDIRAVQWKNNRWSAEYSKRTSRASCFDSQGQF